MSFKSRIGALVSRNEKRPATKMIEMYVDWGDVVTVTDPCYDRGTWCTKEVSGLKEGRYVASPSVERPEKFKIVHEDFLEKTLEKEYIGEIGVDSGMAGFFVDKPDYKTTEEWEAFLKDNNVLGNRGAFRCGSGVFSDTYWGDGSYRTYALWYGNKKVGLMIDFKVGA